MNQEIKNTIDRLINAAYEEQKKASEQIDAALDAFKELLFALEESMTRDDFNAVKALERLMTGIRIFKSYGAVSEKMKKALMEAESFVEKYLSNSGFVALYLLAKEVDHGKEM